MLMQRRNGATYSGRRFPMSTPARKAGAGGGLRRPNRSAPSLAASTRSASGVCSGAQIRRRSQASVSPRGAASGQAGGRRFAARPIRPASWTPPRTLACRRRSACWSVSRAFAARTIAAIRAWPMTSPIRASRAASTGQWTSSDSDSRRAARRDGSVSGPPGPDGVSTLSSRRRMAVNSRSTDGPAASVADQRLADARAARSVSESASRDIRPTAAAAATTCSTVRSPTSRPGASRAVGSNPSVWQAARTRSAADCSAADAAPVARARRTTSDSASSRAARGVSSASMRAARPVSRRSRSAAAW